MSQNTTAATFYNTASDGTKHVPTVFKNPHLQPSNHSHTLFARVQSVNHEGFMRPFS